MKYCFLNSCEFSIIFYWCFLLQITPDQLANMSMLRAVYWSLVTVRMHRSNFVSPRIDTSTQVVYQYWVRVWCHCFVFHQFKICVKATSLCGTHWDERDSIMLKGLMWCSKPTEWMQQKLWVTVMKKLSLMTLYSFFVLFLLVLCVAGTTAWISLYSHVLTNDK